MPRIFRVAFMTGAVVVLVQLAVLGAFVIDPNVAIWPAGMRRPWQSGHSCVSACWVAARQATTAPDLAPAGIPAPVSRSEAPVSA